MNASRHVYRAATNRYWMTDWSAPRWNGWPMTSTMFQTCGSVRSFANGQRNGGFHRIGAPDPGTAPGARHGVPPRNLTPSQTKNTTTMASRIVSGRRIDLRRERGWAASGSSSRPRSSSPMLS